MKFNLTQPTVVSLLRFHLSGFRGYPNSEAGENVFARCLQECCTSVDHCKAVLKTFDQEFPTLREILDTANGLAAKFQPSEDQRAKWEQQYGPPQPFDMSELLNGDPVGKHWAEDREMWRRIKIKLGCKDFSRVSWAQVYRAKLELGYPLAPEEQKILNAAA